MAEIRQNALTGEWVLVAPERARRPHRYAHEGREREERPFDPECPFCPGNEAGTPEALLELPGPDGSWRVRAFVNAYPAVDPSPGPHHAESAAPLDRRARIEGVGRHEVIVETPVHDRGLERMSEAELLDVFRAYRQRFADAARDPRVAHVLIFRNQGSVAGASLLHPHAQLVGLPLVPPLIQSIVNRSREHAGDPGGSLLLGLVEQEVREGVRTLEAGDRWAAFLPHASPNAYEVWLAPRVPIPRFEEAADEDLAELAPMLARVLRRHAELLSEPDYNLILRTPPVEAVGDEAGGFPWHLQVIPRLTSIAGFEIGVGLRINEVPPEEAASRLNGDLE